MSWQDPRLWVAFLAVEGLGNKSLRQVLAQVKSRHLNSDEAWVHLDAIPFFSRHQKLKQAVIQFQKQYSLEGYWQHLQQRQITVVTELSPDYPASLFQVSDRPPVLFIKGSLKTWEQVPIAVIGTRHATAYGQLATEKIVKELVTLGSTIVSGFMYGIDLLAHQAAVKHGGQTIGVLGFGFDYMYPSSQQQLFQTWLAEGQTFVTEYSPNARPTKGTFVQRNRIVAGLAKAVVIIEAAEKSGSLITAQAALEYNREVLAVPGPIHSPYSQGTTWLLNQGATLITSGRQVWEAIGYQPLPGVMTSSARLGLPDPLQEHIYTQLQTTPQTEDQLQELLGRPMNQVLTALSMMEVAGWLKKTGVFWAVNV